jgi:hemolysin activation/secretion protein
MSNNGMNPSSAVQYPLHQAQPPVSRPTGFYPGQNGMQMHSAMPYNNNQTTQHMIDPYRQNMAGAPAAPPGIGGQNGYHQIGYANPMMGMPNNNMNGGYGQYQNQMPQYYQQPPMQSIGQQRRGRVGSSHAFGKASVPVVIAD